MLLTFVQSQNILHEQFVSIVVLNVMLCIVKLTTNQTHIESQILECWKIYWRDTLVMILTTLNKNLL